MSIVVKLAWRRHGHLALNAATMLAVLRSEEDQGWDNFKTVANFIGTRNADLRSIAVTTEFLNQLWRSPIASMCAYAGDEPPPGTDHSI